MRKAFYPSVCVPILITFKPVGHILHKCFIVVIILLDKGLKYGDSAKFLSYVVKLLGNIWKVGGLVLLDFLLTFRYEVCSKYDVAF
jgi:hypothetical protein